MRASTAVAAFAKQVAKASPETPMLAASVAVAQRIDRLMFEERVHEFPEGIIPGCFCTTHSAASACRIALGESR